MERGSLRNVLNVSEQWQDYTPAMRHQILCDVAEGMAFLHSRDVFHRDLKRYCCTASLYTCHHCTHCSQFDFSSPEALVYTVLALCISHFEGRTWGLSPDRCSVSVEHVAVCARAVSLQTHNTIQQPQCADHR
jgi:serine/threonine protein kinase